jgi:hypothetical protein
MAQLVRPVQCGPTPGGLARWAPGPGGRVFTAQVQGAREDQLIVRL